MTDGRRVLTCRSCGGGGLFQVLSLGSTPIANALVDPHDADRPDPSYPLGIVICTACSLVQLDYELPADRIFDEHYPYFSSVSDMFVAHAADHVANLIDQRELGTSSFVVEVASNDGYLLSHFVSAGVPVLGVDPSPGPAGAAVERGVPTLVDFFGATVAAAIRSERGPADVIVANNVMAHVPDLNDFVSGLAGLIAPDGLITIENPYVRELIDRVAFDTIYHEHYCYFSCTAVDRLMRRHGLHLQDVDYFPDLHAGTLRWYIGRADRRSQRCADLLAAEQSAGMTGTAFYEQFADQVELCRTALRAMLVELSDAGRSIAAYGAAAKGATLLNSCGITTDMVRYVVDRNVHKQGRLMPGCRLPIRPVEALLDDHPDDVVLLAWNVADEIITQQHEYLAAGGRFVVPVPVPRFVTGPGG